MGAVAKEAMDVVEAVSDVAEETVEALDHLNNLNGTTKRQQVIILVSVAVASAAAAGVVSHYVTKKVMRTKFEALMAEELEKTRQFFAEREARMQLEMPQPEDPEVILANLKEKAAEAEAEPNEFLVVDDGPGKVDYARLHAIKKETDEVEVIEKSVFDEDQEEAWLKDNKANAAELRPHVISRDEFFEAENEWSQLTFTYFEQDDVLADEREQPVEDTEKIVGSSNLDRFGWLSEDKNTVYIRCPEHEVEVEVIRSEGSYANEVLGFKHGEETFERRLRKSPRDE